MKGDFFFLREIGKNCLLNPTGWTSPGTLWTGQSLVFQNGYMRWEQNKETLLGSWETKGTLT